MAITLAVPPSLRPFSGSLIPGFPLGLWVVFASVLGDATGGVQEIAARFQGVNDPRPSNFYSIEQLMVGLTSEAAGDTLVRLAIENMDEIPASGSTGARFEHYAIRLNTLTGIPIGIGMRLKEGMTLRYFIGAPIKNNLNAQIAIDTDNAPGISMSVKIQGYYWEAGAINAIGGLQRPITGLYG